MKVQSLSSVYSACHTQRVTRRTEHQSPAPHRAAVHAAHTPVTCEHTCFCSVHTACTQISTAQGHPDFHLCPPRWCSPIFHQALPTSVALCSSGAWKERSLPVAISSASLFPSCELCVWGPPRHTLVSFSSHNTKHPRKRPRCFAGVTAVCSSIPNTVRPRQGLLTASSPSVCAAAQGTEVARPDSLKEQ